MYFVIRDKSFERIETICKIFTVNVHFTCTRYYKWTDDSKSNMKRISNSPKLKNRSPKISALEKIRQNHRKIKIANRQLSRKSTKKTFKRSKKELTSTANAYHPPIHKNGPTSLISNRSMCLTRLPITIIVLR